MGLCEYFFLCEDLGGLTRRTEFVWLLALRYSAHLAGDVKLCEVLVTKCLQACLTTILLYSNA